MPDRRPVDSLDPEELERILYLRRQAERAKQREGQPRPHRKPAPRKRALLDILLLFVEIGVIVGVVYLFINGANVLQSLNTQVAAVLALPTLTPPPPTPLITPAYLPSGHTPPTSPGGAQPYEASLPEALRLLITPAPVGYVPVFPTSEPQQPRRMTIPAINIEARVVQGIGWEELKFGIGQVMGTALPGETGNGVYAAHNDIFGEYFRHLDQLRPGDEILIYTASQEFRYIVREWRIVEPTEVSVMDPTPTPTITLISCYPYLVDTQRIVVFADLVTDSSG